MAIPQRKDGSQFVVKSFWLVSFFFGYFFILVCFLTDMALSNLVESLHTVGLVGGTFMIGLGLLTKVSGDSFSFNRRITELEQQIELQRQELTTIKEKHES